MVQWRGRRQSSNVEDRRGRPAAKRGVRLPGKLSGVGIVIIVGIILLGGDPSQFLGLLLGGPESASLPRSQPTSQPAAIPAGDEAAQFVSVVLADTEDTWRALFAESGMTYREPQLVLFSDSVQSACGFNTAATGPFYCPPDQKVYLDLGFFDELRKLGAPGDFAQAYVIGHEVAHHVQNLQGRFASLRKAQARASKADGNALQVLAELQADCYAGVWAHHAEAQRDLLESGDVEEGLRAAASIGDDRLQQRAGRQIQPESFTHGSSAQRVEWFKTGLTTGDPGACNTFDAAGAGAH
jgi:predicted metalloprotease